MTVHAGVDVILKCRVFLSFEETHRTGLVATQSTRQRNHRTTSGLPQTADMTAARSLSS